MLINVENRKNISMPEEQIYSKNNSIRQAESIITKRVYISVGVGEKKLTNNVQAGLWGIWIQGKETGFHAVDDGVLCDAFK